MTVEPPKRVNLSGRRRLPVILQAESAECALACLAMISSWFGRHEDLVSLRRRYTARCRGMTLNSLLEAAAELGFACRAVRCEMAEIDSLALPVILHWDFNHYVVVKSISRNWLTIHDPAAGVRRLSLESAGQHFTGVAVELQPATNFEAKPARSRPGLKHYLGEPANLMGILSQLFLLSGILQVFALAMPFYMQIVVDEVLVRHDADLLIVLAGGFSVLCLLSTVTGLVRGWIGIYLTNQLSFTLGTRLFHHLLSLPAEYFLARQMGDLVSRFGSLKPIQDFLANSSITLLLDGIMATTTLTVMYVYSPLLTMVALGFVALCVAARIAFYLPLRRRQLESIVSEARADSNFMESVRSIGAIKRCCIEASRCGEWQNRYVDSINARVRLGRLSLGLESIRSALTGIGHVLVIYIGARQVLSGNISIGMLYAFLAWRGHLSSAIDSLVDALMKYLMLSLHLERLADISDALPESGQCVDSDLPIDGRLRLSDGGFRYGPRDAFVFRHLNLELAAGEALAVIGPSGCGKSTLLGVMMGSYALEEGELWIDGQCVDATASHWLRRSSASVMQDDTLLSGSIGSNITFGDAAPDVARMLAATHIACIHDDIARLPMGYESLVGEMGPSLSAGQVQRILIARALYRQPRILFLDEGTAHLDSKTEQQVMTRVLSRNMTCVFTTHSRSVLRLAHKVLVMDPGGWQIKQVPKNATGAAQNARRIRSVACPQSVSAANPSVS